MHQSIPPVPIHPRATPGHLFRFTVSGAGHLRTPGTTPREFGTRGFKTVKSLGRRGACFVPSLWRLLWEKIWISRYSDLSAKDKTSLLRFFIEKTI